MKKGFGFIIVCLMAVALLATAAMAGDRDPLIEVLIEKGVLTESEAKEIEAEVAKRESAKAARVVPVAAEGVFVDNKIKITGQVRFRAEAKDNMDFSNLTTDHADFTGQRIRLNIDGRSSDARYFAQIQDTRLWGAEMLTAAGAAAGTADNLDLHQGFIELGKNYTVRIGRQEVTLGSERLVGSFGWSNNGRSFDGLRILADVGQASQLDIYGLKAVEGASTASDDTNLYGLVYHYTGHEDWKPSLYFLYKDMDDNHTVAGDQSAEILSIGHFGKYTGFRNFTLDWEGVLQSGDNAGQNHDAFALHGGVKYTVPGAHKVYVGTEYNLASGDSSATKSKTFDQLYPTNHGKYGYMDYQGWKNMKNWRIYVGGNFTERFSGQIDFHTLRLHRAADAWYSAGGAVQLLDATGASGSDVGNEIDLTFNYKARGNYTLSGGISRFFTGDFVDSINGAASGDSDWMFLMLDKKF